MSELPNPDRTLYVIDGTAMLFRSYFGKIQKTRADGVEVGAVLGLCMAVTKFIQVVQPSYLAAVFDAARLTFRNEIDPRYKANRGDPPEDLVPQFPLAGEALKALGIQCFSKVGYEADDLMATLATQMENMEFQTVLAAADKDLLQCIRPGVWALDMKTYGLIGDAEVKAKFGVFPSQMADLQALVGDSTDNVPGVKGVGAKGASILLQELGSLDEIYRRLEDVPYLPVRGAKSLARKLGEGREDAQLALQLVTLRDDVPYEALNLITPPDLRYRGAPASGEAFFDEMGFHRAYRTLRAWGEE